MNLQFIPKSKFTQEFDIVRFRLSWICISFIAIIQLILTTLFFIEKNPDAWGTFVPLCVCIAMLVILKFTNNYRIIGFSALISGIVVNQYNLFTIMNIHTFVDLLWMMAITFYVFYMLGVKWGIFSFVINVLGLTIFSITTSKESLISALETATTANYVDLYFSIVTTTALSSFFLYKMVETTEKVEDSFKEKIATLQLQKRKIESQNDEKTVLIQEIHHRVKNNLQIVSSMLRLQSNEINQTNFRESFEAAIERINSMAIIHERMYQTKKLTEIKVADYLFGLANDILKNSNVSQKFEVAVNSSQESINPKNIVPFALIINELLTNTLKYAKVGDEKCRITINLEKKNDGVYVSYSDSCKEDHFNRKDEFGYLLIKTLVEQLDGKVLSDSQKINSHLFVFR